MSSPAGYVPNFFGKTQKLKIHTLFRTLGKQLKCIAMSFPESLGPLQIIHIYTNGLWRLAIRGPRERTPHTIEKSRLVYCAREVRGLQVSIVHLCKCELFEEAPGG